MSALCHSQRYPQITRDYGINTLSTEEGERRYRLAEHRNLKKLVPSSEGVDAREDDGRRDLKRDEDAWAELSKIEKKKQLEGKKKDTDKDGPGRENKRDEDAWAELSKIEKKIQLEGKKKDTDKDGPGHENKQDSKKKEDKKKQDDKSNSEKKKEKKKKASGRGKAPSYSGKNHHSHDKQHEICVCDDDDHDNWSEDRYRGHRLLDEDSDVSDWDEAPELYEVTLVDSLEPLNQHSMGRSLVDLFGVFKKHPSGQQADAGNITTVAAKRSLNKGEVKKQAKDHDWFDDDDHNFSKEKGSKSSKSGHIKKSKQKGGKLKQPGKSQKQSGKSQKQSGKSQKQSGKSQKQSSKATKKVSGGKSSKNSKSSKSCKCRPVTQRPTARPSPITKKPQKSSKTNKPHHNIFPKPTTKKPTRTMRPTNKPQHNIAPKPTTKKPIRTMRPTQKPFGRPTPQPSE
jgi:hypothetical protein